MATEETASQEQVVQVESTVPRDADIEDTLSPQVTVGKEEEEEEVEQVPDKRKGKPKEGTALRDREPGKSILPFSRVQRIVKADKVSVPVALRRVSSQQKKRADE